MCEYQSADEGACYRQQLSALVGHILISVQRVMFRHSDFSTATDPETGKLIENLFVHTFNKFIKMLPGSMDFECCRDLHRISTRNLNDMQSKEVRKKHT